MCLQCVSKNECVRTEHNKSIEQRINGERKIIRNRVLREQRHLPLVLALTYRLRDVFAAANGKSKFYCWIFFFVDYQTSGNMFLIFRVFAISGLDRSHCNSIVGK